MAPFASIMMLPRRTRKASRPRTPPSPQSFWSATPVPVFKPEVLDITLPSSAPVQQPEPQENIQSPVSAASVASQPPFVSLDLGELDFSTSGFSESLSDWINADPTTRQPTPPPVEPSPPNPPDEVPVASTPPIAESLVTSTQSTNVTNCLIAPSTDSLSLKKYGDVPGYLAGRSSESLHAPTSLGTSTPSTTSGHSLWPNEKHEGPSKERINAPLPPLPPIPASSIPQPRRNPPAPIKIPNNQGHAPSIFVDHTEDAESSRQSRGRPPSYRTIASPRHLAPNRDFNDDLPQEYLLYPAFLVNGDHSLSNLPSTLTRQDSATLPEHSPTHGGGFGGDLRSRSGRAELARMRSAIALDANAHSDMLSTEDKITLKRNRSAQPVAEPSATTRQRPAQRVSRLTGNLSPVRSDGGSPIPSPAVLSPRPRYNSAPKRPVPRPPPPIRGSHSSNDLPLSDSTQDRIESPYVRTRSVSFNSQSSAVSATYRESSDGHEPALAQYLDYLSPTGMASASSSAVPSPRSSRVSATSRRASPSLIPVPTSGKVVHPVRSVLGMDTGVGTPPASSHPSPVTVGSPKTLTPDSTQMKNPVFPQRTSSKEGAISMSWGQPDQTTDTAQQNPQSPAVSPSTRKSHRKSPLARRRSGSLPASAHKQANSPNVPLTFKMKLRGNSPANSTLFPQTPTSPAISTPSYTPQGMHFDRHTPQTSLPPPGPPPQSTLPALPPTDPNGAQSVHAARNRPPLPLGPRRPPERGLKKSMSPPGKISLANSISGSLPPSPRFETAQVPWRGLTIDAARWTFSSKQLQEIVRRAIRQSTESTSIRLLPPKTVDREIPSTMNKLEERKKEIKAKYKAHARKRQVLTRSLGLYMDGSDTAAAVRLVEELAEVSQSCDQLCEELHLVTDQLSQMAKLLDDHSAGALAMALRKINTSFLRVNGEVVDLRTRVAELEAEKEEGWAVAQAVAQAIERENEASSADNAEEAASRPNSRPASVWSSRVSAARKTSLRASKASLRSYRSHRSSTASLKYNSVLTPSVMDASDIPPVPPMPNLPQSSVAPLNHHSQSHAHSQSLSYAYASQPESVIGGSPVSPDLALQIAHSELLEMLGISPAEFKETRFLTRGFRGRSYSETATPAPSPPASPIVEDVVLPPPRPPGMFKLVRSASDHVVARRRAGSTTRGLTPQAARFDHLYDAITEDPQTLMALLSPRSPRPRLA